MRARGVIVVLGCVAMAGVCSCGTRRLNDADTGVGPASQSSFTVDWTQSTPGRGIRLACSSGGDAIAYYIQAPASQARRYHARAWADPVALPVLADQVQAAVMSSDGVATFAWAVDSSTVPMTDDVYVGRLAGDDGWSDPILVGNGGIGWWQDPTLPQPVISLDTSGSGVLTWSRIDEESSQPTTWPAAVWAANGAADGTWLNVGSIDQPGGSWSSRPSLLARGDSDTIAAWGWTDGTRAQVLVARRTGSQWSAPSVVEDAAAANLRFWGTDGPMLAGGRTGDMVLLYQRVDQGPTVGEFALVSRQSPDGVSWSGAEVLTPSGASWFQLVHNGAGGVAAIWSDPPWVQGTTNATMRVWAPGAAWLAPLTVITSATGSALVAQHPDGRIAFFYEQGDGSSPSAVVLRSYTPAGGWQAARIVDQNGQSVSGLCFAGDHLVAAWQRSSTAGVVGVFP